MLFNKLKSLFPVFVISGAVVITIKLLTTVTPENQELIQVKAEEDIRTEEYTDPIEEPQQPPAPEEQEVPPEEKPPAEEAPEDTEREEEENADEAASDESSDEAEKQQEEAEQKEEQQKPQARKFNGLAERLGLTRILGGSKGK